MAREIEVVVNPTAGAGLGTALVESHVKPLLEGLGATVRVHRTESEGDGKRIGSHLLTSHSSRDYLDIVLVGGDGTTHEVLNGLYLPDIKDPFPVAPAIRLAVVPAGTANALYSSLYPEEWTQDIQALAANAKSIDELEAETMEKMLRSIKAMAQAKRRDGEERDLPLILNELCTRRSDGKYVMKRSISHLVTSYAMHAAILHDADTPEMRAKHPGIERFKAAAQLNATRWTDGYLDVDSSNDPTDKVESYYLGSRKDFVPIDMYGRSVGFEIEGAFLYLNSMVTDRLESAFIPAPLSSAAELPKGKIDLVVVRPDKHPGLRHVEDKQKAAETFATTTLAEIVKGMYSGGQHIDLTYDDGEPVVDYYRCANYSFGSLDRGDTEILVCTDGVVSKAISTWVKRWPWDEPKICV